eukprot:CFRG1014T1
MDDGVENSACSGRGTMSDTVMYEGESDAVYSGDGVSITVDDKKWMEPRVLTLVKCRDQILLWDVDDCVYMRSQLRLLGDAVGPLPTQIHQNIILGLPMAIAPECVRMLVDQGKAKLVNGDAILVNTEEYQKAFCSARSESFKRQRIRATALEKDGGHFGKPLKNEIKQLYYPNATREGTSITVPLVHDPTRTSVLPAIEDWNFPASQNDRMRCRVFRDLYERGFYITSGCKFGGEYLCYKEDPAVCHSTFIVRIVPWTVEMTALQIVGLGRLGVAVKKTSLLASVNEVTDELRYISLSRSPFDTPREK